MAKHTLEQQIMNDLKEGGKLHNFLEKVKSDDTLDMEFRGKNVEIYYRGGLLLNIESTKNGNYQIIPNNSYWPETNKYKTQPSEEEALQQIYLYKAEIDAYPKRRDLEKEFQQLLVRENNYLSEIISGKTDYYIIDTEYIVADTRFDAIALKLKSTQSESKYKKNIGLAILEVKIGNGAMTGSCGIQDHIKKYINFCENSDALNDFYTDSIENFKQKCELGLIKKLDDPKYKIQEIPINPENKIPELIFIFANHDPESQIIVNELTNTINTLKDTEKEYLKHIFIAKSSEMGYGLYRYDKNEKDRYLSIKEYIESNK